MDDIKTETSAEDPIEKLRTVIFTEPIQANPIALAVLGWITGLTVTEPWIEELRTGADGSVLIRRSGETYAQSLCSLPLFLGQVLQLCTELGLTLEQADEVVARVEKRLT